MVRPLIPERTLLQLEQIAKRSYRSTCRIGRRPLVEDTRGGSRRGDPVYDAAVPCRVDPPGAAKESFYGEQVVSRTTSTVSVSLDTTPPDNEDVIEVTTPDVGDGPARVELYNVVGTALRGSSYAVELTIAVERIGN